MDIETFIDNRFRIKFILKFCLGLVILSMISSLFFLFILPKEKVNLYFSFFTNFQYVKEMFVPILIAVGLFEIVLSALFSIVLLLFVSHKIGGPIFKLEQNIEKIKNGDLSIPKIRFRSYDQGKVLAESFNNMVSGLNNVFCELKSTYALFAVKLEVIKGKILKSSYEVESIREAGSHVKEMENILKRFNTLN